MRLARVLVVLCAVAGIALARPAAAPQAPSRPTIDQFLGASSAVEVASAKKVDRIAWVAYERGKRNVYTAAAPAFTPVRLTNFMNDDGVDLTKVTVSDDGSTVAFVRGTGPNRSGWDADPNGDPNGGEEAIWAVRVATPGQAVRVVEGGTFELAPDGSSVIFAKDGEIYRAVISLIKPATEMDRGEKPFIKIWGTNTTPKWSPDGRRIAFVSTRTDHGFIGVYEMATRSVKYMAPSTDFDSMPVWSADGKHITFMRRPGLPYGQQATPGWGGGGPQAAAPAPAAAAQGARGGASAQAQAPAQAQGARGAAPAVSASLAQIPGMTRATFKGGYTMALWRAELATGEAREVWHPSADERIANNLNQVRWAGDDTFIFGGGGAGGGRGGGGGAGAAGADEWDRYYSLTFTQPNAKPVMLTTTDGFIEDATSVAVSADGKTFFYCTNAKDIERRHIWAVSSQGGTPVQVTTGAGIETDPAPLSSGRSIATLSATWNMPMSLGVWSTTDHSQKVIFPTSRPGFPTDAHVEPTLVITKADDGLEVHNDLFVPKGIRPGEKRPAMVFVHGGPVREMLLGYHYRYVYHQFYAMNEWLASRGYIVLSINYRGGVGYGRSFQNAPNTNARGNAEYQDVLAGAKYLQSRDDVDTKRIGIYGLSYGGLLTSQALARNSDVFAAGIDYAGVHLYGSSLDPNDLSYKSSAISQIDKWKSPVLLIQGDDDRNVYFQQTTGLVQLLRQRDVYFELLVLPDDVHDSLIYGRWVQLLGRMDAFLQKFFGDPTASK